MTLPAIDTLDTYGGAFQDAAPVEDPTTDESAVYRNKYAANVAAMTQTACRAWCAFVGHASDPADPSSHVHGAVWGNAASVKPAVSREAEGVYEITFPEEITDDLGEEHVVNLRRAWWNVEGETPYVCTATVTAPNVITFRVFDASGSADDGADTVFTVFAV